MKMPNLTLATFIEQTQADRPGFALDYWQRDLVCRLEKAFWLANARSYTFVETCTGQRVEAPSGMTIDRSEFDEQKDRTFRIAIFAPPQHGRTFLLTCFLAWIGGIRRSTVVVYESYNLHHSQRIRKCVETLVRLPVHGEMFPCARLFGCEVVSLGPSAGDVRVADVHVKDDRYRSTEAARQHVDDSAQLLKETGYDCWRYAALADPGWSAPGQEDDLDWQLLPSDRSAGEFLSPRFEESHYARAVDAGVWIEQFQGRYRLRAATASLVFLRGAE